MSKLCAKIVPKHERIDQKENRLQVCQDWLENVDLFENVITGDEYWIFEYDSDTKKQILEWKSFGTESHGKRKPSCKNKNQGHFNCFDSRTRPGYSGPDSYLCLLLWCDEELASLRERVPRRISGLRQH